MSASASARSFVLSDSACASAVNAWRRAPASIRSGFAGFEAKSASQRPHPKIGADRRKASKAKLHLRLNGGTVAAGPPALHDAGQSRADQRHHPEEPELTDRPSALIDRHTHR